MIGIRIFLLVLHIMEVLSYQFTYPIRMTPRNAVGRIDDNINIQPEDYSWIAHLKYRSGYKPQCKGSVISARHVLTDAQCVTGNTVKNWGGLIGVRMGDFIRGPHCRTDTSECTFKLFARIEHVNYEMEDGIALVRLTRELQFEPPVQRVCLLIRMLQLTESGYALMINLNELTAKQVVIIPFLEKIECELQNGFMMCTGVFAATTNSTMFTCDSHSGEAPERVSNRRKMRIKAIRSSFQGDNFGTVPLKQEPNSLNWIEHNVHSGSLDVAMGTNAGPKTSTNSSFLEHYLPTDCGYSPFYSREDSHKIKLDQFSWLASLVYEKNRSAFGHCSGSVISSRYVLTAARCVDNNNHANLGKVVAVRLGNFAKEPFCDYGTEGCARYLYYSIKSFKNHEEYTSDSKRLNDIALLKLKRDIVFGDKMKPICLPFGKNNDIERPEEDSFLTVAGWWTTTFPNDVIAKRSEAVAFWNTTGCMEADRDKNTQICGVKPEESPCTTEFGSPLMNMFQRRRMVLEGIAYDSVTGCPGRDVGTLYTRVRSYGEWIESTIELLETMRTPQFPTNCGWTPMYPKELIVGGNITQPDEYSWLASLQYGAGDSYGFCGGSVINTHYVLTAAHCVTGKEVDGLGGLTGVRLGNYSQKPYCDYGTSNCTFYLYFGITKTTVHINYTKDSNFVLHNDIALVQLNRSVPFDNVLKPVCLPFGDVPEPTIGTILTVVGWGKSMSNNELVAKRAVGLHLVTDADQCEFKDQSRICAGDFINAKNVSTTCQGDSGGPLMQEWQKRKMVVEGIVSFVQGGNCASEFVRTHYIRVRNYLSWIEENVEHQLPTGCGYTPIYPRKHKNSSVIEPDEFSWVASLVYGTIQNSFFGNCSGSVISSRYVLTAASCIFHSQLGQVIGIRLGKFEREPFCDYGTEGCGSYQYFPIESFKQHENYRFSSKRMNDIALLKLQRDIVFGDKMKPICLPFNTPELDSFLTVAGWWTTTFPNNVIAKRSEAVAFLNTTGCMTADHDKNTQICGVKPEESPCTTEFGSPLMNMFERRRMVLEGIAYDSVKGCPGRDVGTLYTNVRKYGEWILNSISQLETRITSGNNSNFWKSFFNRKQTYPLSLK